MLSRGSLLAPVTAIAALVLLPAPALAATEGWIEVPSTAPVSPAGASASGPAVAVNADGAEVVAWLVGKSVLASVRAPGGGTYGAPVTINSPTESSFLGAPSVAIDAAGDTLVAWSEYNGSTYSVQLAVGAPGQPVTQGAAAPSEAATATPKLEPHAMFLADGTALVVWAGFGGAVEYVVRPPGGSFGTTATLANNNVEQLAAAPAGATALVSWDEVGFESTATSSTTTYVAKAATLSAGGALSGVQTIGTVVSTRFNNCNETFSCTDTSLNGLGVAADAAGDGLAFYTEANTFDFFITTCSVKALYRTGGGAFATPAASYSQTSTLSCPAANGGLLGDGTALLAWSESLGSGGLGYVQRAPTGAFPSEAQKLTPTTAGETYAEPRIAPRGADGLLAYLRNNKEVLAQAFTDGGPQGAPVALSAGDRPIVSAPALSDDGNGDAVAVWSREDTAANGRVEAAAYDSGPRLSGLRVPASGLTGDPLSFGAAASDPLSPVALDWTFGDGATASGANVTHAYATPGAQTASVVATDAAGLVTAPLSGVTQVALAPSTRSQGQGGPGHGGQGAVVLSLKISKQRLREVLRKGLAVTVGCSGPCTLELALRVSAGAAKSLGLAAGAAVAGEAAHATRSRRHHKRGPVTVGRLRVTFTTAGTKTVHVKLTNTSKRRLRHARKLTLSVVESVSGVGAPKPVTQQITLR